MKLNEHFKNVFSYAAGMEKWCKDFYQHPDGLSYTFCMDFAIADWMEGAKGVKETYKRVKKNWLGNYKAFTEVVISLNLLSWAHRQLLLQGFEGREEMMQLYSEMYYLARDDFYKEYGSDGKHPNQEACDYFFEMTD